MTNDNYTIMSNHELLTCLNNYKVTISHLLRVIKRRNPELLNELINRTKFLDEYYSNLNESVPLPARLYCLEHDLESQPICKHDGCNVLVEWSRGYGKFRDFCCTQHSNSDESVIKKMEDAKNARFGNPHYVNPDKARSTSVNRYGVVNPMCLREVQEKAKKTCLRNNGVEYPMQSKIIKSIAEQTNEKLYGGKSPACSKRVIEKMQETCEQKFGVKSFSQTKEFHQKCHKKYTNDKYPGMTFGSSWEFKVYDFLKEHRIEFKYQLEPIPYEYDDNTYYYIPDFLVNGRIYEVKGDNFFRINESTGKEEMYKPWRRTEWSDEYYQWLCDKEEAKHQCMLSHNVIILRESDIMNLTKRLAMFKLSENIQATADKQVAGTDDTPDPIASNCDKKPEDCDKKPEGGVLPTFVPPTQETK